MGTVQISAKDNPYIGNITAESNHVTKDKYFIAADTQLYQGTMDFYPENRESVYVNPTAVDQVVVSENTALVNDITINSAGANLDGKIIPSYNIYISSLDYTAGDLENTMFNTYALNLFDDYQYNCGSCYIDTVVNSPGSASYTYSSSTLSTRYIQIDMADYFPTLSDRTDGKFDIHPYVNYVYFIATYGNSIAYCKLGMDWNSNTPRSYGWAQIDYCRTNSYDYRIWNSYIMNSDEGSNASNFYALNGIIRFPVSPDMTSNITLRGYTSMIYRVL